MNDESMEFLTELLETPSPTGLEFEAQKVWAQELEQYADEVECDAYGSTWAKFFAKDAKAPTLMIEAHADEIGFMIRYVTPEGFLRVERVGGSDIAIARGRRIRFMGTQGEVVGITGNTAIHLRGGEDTVPKTWDIFVDVGASSAKEVEEMGLRVGHIGVYCDGPMLMNGKKLVCRALDNRISGFILSELARKLKKSKKELAWNLVLLNAVQEEVGGHGATMATFRIRPDAAICLDVTHATDSPDLSKDRYGDIKLGKGPALTFGTANHPNVTARLELAADKSGIPVQFEASSRCTGTDTDSIFISREGVPSALVSIPLRYMHSPVETADLDDVDATVELLHGFIKSLKKSDDFRYSLGK
ncbi:M42 family metallopeptidase [Akkermansia sp. N21169]|jgi:putative aminopeptidase FrvX|uniref:M42 family metallopeptidase n=1 Tax=unclassified Akkermansia TaxID=2608915 RepID=UPI00244E6937|nr:MULTISPECIES: M42 family metallopeptidase [unclassified Akkermansia]MDH3068434.1 M42 family metallopeptidase [Akkermansia sp. N21169]WPX39796.1 M42 family metallopeptidase [Akkermansia sp. N21116]